MKNTGKITGAVPASGMESVSPPATQIPGIVTLSVAKSFNSGIVTATEWNSLVALCDAPVYSTWEWQSLWWEHLGSLKKGRALTILVFRVGEQVVAIAPFFMDPEDISGRSILRLVGSGEAFRMSGGMLLDDGPSDYLDILADRKYIRQVAAELAAYLRLNCQTLDGCELVNLRPGGIGSSGLLPEMKKLGFKVDTTGGDVCPYIVVDSDTTEFIRKQGSSLRRRLTQAFRLLEDGSCVYTENHPQGWDNFFNDLIELHQNRWNRAGFPGLFHDSESRTFQKAVAGTFMKNGWLWSGSLYQNGRCVGVRMGFNFQGRMYDYLSGFDETSAAARRRPGIGLLLGMHRAARGLGTGILDMLRGDEKYKFELTTQAVRLLNARILQPEKEGSRGTILRSTASATRMLGFMFGREARLLAVQSRQHGIAGGLIKYLSFRTDRLRRKFAPCGEGSSLKNRTERGNQ